MHKIVQTDLNKASQAGRNRGFFVHGFVDWRTQRFYNISKIQFIFASGDLYDKSMVTDCIYTAKQPSDWV
jgi:hypothetical protein